MSLDVYIETRCEHCGHEEEHGAFNYTYNLGPLWRDAIAVMLGIDCTLGRYLDEHEEYTSGRAGDVVEPLTRMLQWMHNHPDISKYDAPNGWGTGTGGRDFVVAIRDCCEAHPEARVRVSR